jgi:hypothetical protein
VDNSEHWNNIGFLFDDSERLYKVQGVATVSEKVKNKIFRNKKILEKVHEILPEHEKLDFFGTKFFPKFP